MYLQTLDYCTFLSNSFTVICKFDSHPKNMFLKNWNFILWLSFPISINHLLLHKLIYSRRFLSKFPPKRREIYCPSMSISLENTILEWVGLCKEHFQSLYAVHFINSRTFKENPLFNRVLFEWSAAFAVVKHLCSMFAVCIWSFFK